MNECKIFLVVGGEVKAGKSTFINSLIGNKLLPVNFYECTSNIVIIEP